MTSLDIRDFVDARVAEDLTEAHDLKAMRRVAALKAMTEGHNKENYLDRAMRCEDCAAECHDFTGLGCEYPTDAVWPCYPIREIAAIWDWHADYVSGWALLAVASVIDEEPGFREVGR